MALLEVLFLMLTVFVGVGLAQIERRLREIVYELKKASKARDDVGANL